MRPLLIAAILTACFLLVACGQVSTTSTPPATYSITVDWGAAADGIGTFYLYRNSQRIFSSPLAVTSFTDDAVAPGNKYCYYVTAFADGLESPPSQQACANVPTAAYRQEIHLRPSLGATVRESDQPPASGFPVIPAYDSR